MSKDRTKSEFESVGTVLLRDSKLKPIAPQETEDAHKLPRLAGDEFQNIQLNLFQTFLANNDGQRDELSNAIDLWDSVPRYSVSRQAMNKARINGRFLEKHEAIFQHRGRMYTRVLFPARITDSDGKDREYYPSATEELVEDALRKIATEQQAGYFDKTNYQSGVMFTLYALREELKKRGHARSYQEIVQSLNILSHCHVDIIPHDTSDGDGVISSPCIPALAAVSRTKLREDPKAKWVVQFHPLVTGSIDQVTYRQYNYHLMMSHSTQLARWVHKQLVLKYTFADLTTPFEMRHSTVKRDSGLLDGYKRSRDGIDALEVAISELKERGVLLGYKRKDSLGPRRKLLDVVFTITPHLDFIRETKAANRRQNDSEKAVGLGRGSTPKAVGSGRGSR
jgi:hypothetical protein